MSRPVTTLDTDYRRVTASAPGRKSRSMELSELGPLVYHVTAGPEGVELVRSGRR